MKKIEWNNDYKNVSTVVIKVFTLPTHLKQESIHEPLWQKIYSYI